MGAMMVNILCQPDPKLYTQYLILDNGKIALYTEAAKTMYGRVDIAFLF